MKKGDKTGYARGIKDGRNVFMHWEVRGKGCDHINRNGLDNRRSNLREADTFQQSQNRGIPRTKKTPGCKGVTIVKDHRGVPKYWIARVTVRGSRKYLGTFKTHEEASKMAEKFTKEHHREFASVW